MHVRKHFFLPLLLAGAFATGPALANTCRTERLSCSTAMPDGGYCECTSHGNTEDGTVMSTPPMHHATKATAGGCGSNPQSPGCR